jgi:hypothetical protein
MRQRICHVHNPQTRQLSGRSTLLHPKSDQLCSNLLGFIHLRCQHWQGSSQIYFPLFIFPWWSKFKFGKVITICVFAEENVGKKKLPEQKNIVIETRNLEEKWTKKSTSRQLKILKIYPDQTLVFNYKAFKWGQLGRRRGWVGSTPAYSPKGQRFESQGGLMFH